MVFSGFIPNKLTEFLIGKNPTERRIKTNTALHSFYSDLQLVGQSFSALGSSSGQNFSAVRRGHSLSEAVLLLSVELLRLICSQHSETPSLQTIALQYSIIAYFSAFVKYFSSHEIYVFRFFAQIFPSRLLFCDTLKSDTIFCVFQSKASQKKFEK